jgi:4-hydroxybenzoate polyprenyltransferase
MQKTLSTYGSLVKVSHTVFALPFALAAVILASQYAPVTAEKVLLIVLCIAAARTAAMAFNRLVDRDIDAKNPRTQDREIPSGALTVMQVRVLVVASCVVFVLGAARLGTLPLYLSPVALGLALGYSYTKRFTALCHVILGCAVAFAPGGAWIAIGAGFDVLYSLQDRGFDQGERLHSIPVSLGVVGALVVSALLHVVTVACLAYAGVVLERGLAYMLGVGMIAALLVVEHALVRPSDLSKLNKAFFDINGYVSVAFLVFVGIDQFMR